MRCETPDPAAEVGYRRVEAGGIANRDRVRDRPVHGGLAAEFLAGQVAHRDQQIALALDLADVPGPQPGSGRRWRRSAAIAPGSIAGPGWGPAGAAGTLLARRHSAAARCERAELAVHTNSTLRAARPGGMATESRAPGTSRR